MAYPDDFNTSAFPAGKRVALSRTAGIWIMVSFLLIILCCLAIPWVLGNKTVEPFVIYVNGPRGEWELLGHQGIKQDIPYYTSMQRALVGNFVQEWFAVSDNQNKNTEHWGKCNRQEDCRINSTLYGDEECGIYCVADDELYRSFTANVLPLYQSIASFGERWRVNTSTISANADGPITDKGGSWIVNATVRSSVSGDFKIIAYIGVAHDMEKYPQTLGYYVTTFNAYREQ